MKIVFALKQKKPHHKDEALILSILTLSYYFNGLSSETVSFLRPFARRLANTLRPFAVCMRSRKPCTDLRRRVCGWNVRFIINVLLTQKFYFNYQETVTITASLWKDGEGKAKIIIGSFEMELFYEPSLKNPDLAFVASHSCTFGSLFSKCNAYIYSSY